MRDLNQSLAVAGHLGDLESARRGLKSTESRSRALALGALARLDALGPAEVQQAATDPAPAVRRRLAELAPRLSWALTARPETSSLLIDLLADDNTSVAEMAAWALGECRPVAPGTVAALGAIARSHDDALCREAAVAALGAIGDRAGLPTILAALDDRATVRRRAVIALAPFEGDEVDAALEAARDDRDKQVRQAAEDLLGR